MKLSSLLARSPCFSIRKLQWVRLQNCSWLWAILARDTSTSRRHFSSYSKCSSYFDVKDQEGTEEEMFPSHWCLILFLCLFLDLILPQVLTFSAGQSVLNFFFKPLASFGKKEKNKQKTSSKKVSEERLSKAMASVFKHSEFLWDTDSFLSGGSINCRNLSLIILLCLFNYFITFQKSYKCNWKHENKQPSLSFSS